MKQTFRNLFILALVLLCTACLWANFQTASATVEEPQFASHPADQTVKLGNRAVFTVAFDGDVTAYQWQYQITPGGPWWNNTAYTEGYNTSTLNVIAAEKRQGFLYRCRVTDAYGSKHYSNAAALTVDITKDYTVLSQPGNACVTVGDMAVFAVKTQGNVASYQWQYSTNGGKAWYNSSSATQGYNTDTLTVEATAARNQFCYRCKLTDSDARVYYTEKAVLSVQAVVFTAQPADVTVQSGGFAVFSVAVSGEIAKYEWQFSTNGGANWQKFGFNTNKNTLTVKVTESFSGYLCRCVITDTDGKQYASNGALLKVTGSTVIAPEDEDPDLVIDFDDLFPSP